MLPLVAEITAALRGRLPFEIVYIDDHSRDDTLAVLQGAEGNHRNCVLHHVNQSGQSTAVRTGVKHARAPWIATLDGDGQNDPADIPKLLAARDAADAQVKLFAGWRVNRQDSSSKRWASRWANAIRARMRDDTPTPVAASSCSNAARSSTCRISTTCRYLPALMQRRLEDHQCAGQPPPPYRWRVQVQQPRPCAGRHPRSAWRGLADHPKQAHRGGEADGPGASLAGSALTWLYWTGLHVTGWKLIGYTGALMFGALAGPVHRLKRAGKPVIPRLFWYMSVIGSLMTLSYFLFSAKQDSVGVLQNLFPAFTALYSLHLDIKHRGWKRDKASH